MLVSTGKLNEFPKMEAVQPARVICILGSYLCKQLERHVNAKSYRSLARGWRVN